MSSNKLAANSDLSSSPYSETESNEPTGKGKRVRKLATAQLISDGDSDEEIERLKQIIREKTSELNDEKQSTKKVIKIFAHL